MGVSFQIEKIKINNQIEPLGLDEKEPLISWVFTSAQKGMKQAKSQIRVRESRDGSLVWDTGRMETDRSIGIHYAGQPLKPETCYIVWVEAEDTQGETAVAETFFETGLMDPHEAAWDGASWIGAPEYMVASDTIGAFALESRFRIEEGSQAGFVFGAQDARLLDRTKNEAFLEGDNYIRYVIDLAGLSESATGAGAAESGKTAANTSAAGLSEAGRNHSCALLKIYRAGYDAADRPDVPLYTLPLLERGTGRPVLTRENMHEEHAIRIEVRGNGAYTWLDGMLVDESERETETGRVRCPRQLNPQGIMDVTTFPRLCSIGYYAGKDSTVWFDGLHVRNLREPQAEIVSLDTDKGKRLSGEAQEIYDPSCHSLPMLRRDFTVRGKVRSARLYATARGIYECRINGHQVGNEYFAPGASQFDHHLLYQTIDVTGMLREGRNGIGCILASGWWSDGATFRVDNYNYWGDRPSFLCRLAVNYEDGSRDIFVSNEQDWDYYGEGPWRYAGFFYGEQFDARREEIWQRFSEPDFRIEGMKKPEVISPVPQPEGEGIFPGACPWPAMNQTETALIGNDNAPVREVGRFTAKAMTEPFPGVYIYDLGQEIAGAARIRLHEEAGRKITLRYAEMLYPPLEKYGMRAGTLLQANLRDATSTDIYICRGGGEEICQPRFTFRGFRYIEVSGTSHAPALEEVEGVLLSSVEKITGTFSCDNPLINRFALNVAYSQYTNFISIPTDCPQRNERMGWMGDTHIFCHTANLQADVKQFYLRNLQAMADMQSADGRLPSIAPFGGGFGGFTYESAMILIVRELYLQYGDEAVVKRSYDAMKRWMKAIRKTGIPGVRRSGERLWLGDWLALHPTDDNLLWNACHYRNARIMAQFAGILGQKEDQLAYENEAERTRKFWNETFLDPETGKCLAADGSFSDVQGSYCAALDCGVVDEAYRGKVLAHLVRLVEENEYKIDTGFFTTGALNTVLDAGGYGRIAGKMMTQTAFPGWLYPVTQGATTVWERWNGYTQEDGFGDNNFMNSFDHYSLGSVLSWLYESILGIQRDENSPGWQKFNLRPSFHTFRHAGGGIETPLGRVESSWEKTDRGVIYRCRIPANASAVLYLDGQMRELGSGSYEIEAEV